ncbi:MAG: hypothetical protein KAX18_06875, partial [Candidatus Lokiarchaeota archaeon]|nr:hypothetical protein [Candidatus Lokiarchaeota archaeon]
MVLITSSNLPIKAKAHAPNGMNFGVSSNPPTLDILIYHEVEDPNTHYINLVRISVNGSEILSTTYTNQTLTGGGSYNYPFNYTVGDRIDVYASCIEGGSMTACFIVGGGSCPSSSGPGIPGYFGLWLIIGFSLMVSIVIAYKKIRY